jgi:hypothetical protein
MMLPCMHTLAWQHAVALLSLTFQRYRAWIYHHRDCCDTAAGTDLSTRKVDGELEGKQKKALAAYQVNMPAFTFLFGHLHAQHHMGSAPQACAMSHMGNAP